MYIVVILLFLIIGFLEIYPLHKKKLGYELRIYIVFFTIAFILSLLISFGIELPKISKGIELIIRTVIPKTNN